MIILKKLKQHVIFLHDTYYICRLKMYTRVIFRCKNHDGRGVPNRENVGEWNFWQKIQINSKQRWTALFRSFTKVEARIKSHTNDQ